jgi:glutathione S-transferase
VPYQVKFYQRDANLRAPKELLKIHPLGKAPVITDGDFTLAESGAIIQYIINKYGNGRVAPPKEGELVDLYSSPYSLTFIMMADHDLLVTHFAEGSFMPLLVNRFIFSMAPAQAPFFLRPLVKAILSALDANIVAGPLNASLKYIEEVLEKSPTGWFAGGPNPTTADYMMNFGLDELSERRPDLVGPKTKAWAKQVHERPAYKRATVKGEEQK